MLRSSTLDVLGLRFLWDFSVHSFLPQGLVTLGVWERKGVFGHPLRTSDEFDGTQALGLPYGATCAHLCVDAPILGRKSLLEHRREEWVVPPPFLWIPTKVRMDEVASHSYHEHYTGLASTKDGMMNPVRRKLCYLPVRIKHSPVVGTSSPHGSWLKADEASPQGILDVCKIRVIIDL